MVSSDEDRLKIFDYFNIEFEQARRKYHPYHFIMVFRRDRNYSINMVYAGPIGQMDNSLKKLLDAGTFKKNSALYAIHYKDVAKKKVNYRKGHFEVEP